VLGSVRGGPWDTVPTGLIPTGLIPTGLIPTDMVPADGLWTGMWGGHEDAAGPVLVNDGNTILTGKGIRVGLNEGLEGGVGL
jgi:hypothetical protein